MSNETELKAIKEQLKALVNLKITELVEEKIIRNKPTGTLIGGKIPEVAYRDHYLSKAYTRE